ncbi:MAG: amylo-alpha-1,6-glucosidase [Lachnoclostridium sp.]
MYYKAVGDKVFIQEMYPVMERIIEGYRHGTEYGIHMDEDGLILAGGGLDQVTWMDVRVGEILPTPRHGKPVEINAYWYNALCIMEQIGTVTGKTKGTYGKLAELVKKSFEQEFWLEDKKCLKDVVSGTDADSQIRCNQIWAVSMPFTMLDREKEKKIVDTVFEKLYTPYGLRSLEEADSQFHGHYGGSVFERDMAYHQGTVWVFPLGGYYLAYLKVHDYSEKAKLLVREQLEVLESAMREGCIGQLPEIYDGENPCSSKGCFAQAWSVGELLRVYDAIEKENNN